MDNPILLYGANGYTGELIARHASSYGLKPILAGRNSEIIRSMAQKLSLPYEIFSLDDKASLNRVLQKVKMVIHAAGPFQFTAKQMVDACIETKRHYIDINGDISVFESIKKYDQVAKDAGIMLLPGAGFDVIPTDCLALALKKKMPDAISLKLAFATLGGSISHGTATSMVHKLGEGGAIRKDHKIVKVPLGQHGMTVNFGKKEIFVMSIPWGDVSTAHFTTGIPNIEAFTGMSKKVYRVLKLQAIFNPILRTGAVRRILLRKIDKRPAGATDEQRSKAIGFVWGEVSDAAGKKITATLSGPEGYTITMHGTLLIASKILDNKFIPGYQTPASAYGEALVKEIPGVTTTDF